MKFETKKTYQARSVCDYDCIITFHCNDRTDKMVMGWVGGEYKRFRVTVRDGVEQFKPWGTYSMAPIMTAEKIADVEWSMPVVKVCNVPNDCRVSN